MPRLRALTPPPEAAPPPPPNEIRLQLRKDWRMAAISQFVHVFRDSWNLNQGGGGGFDFEIEDLEADLDGTRPLNCVPRLLGKLLNTLAMDRNVNASNWQVALRRQYRRRYGDNHPFAEWFRVKKDGAPMTDAEVEAEAISEAAKKIEKVKWLEEALKKEKEDRGGQMSDAEIKTWEERQRKDGRMAEEPAYWDTREVDWSDVDLETQITAIHNIVEWHMQDPERWRRQLVHEVDQYWRMETTGVDSNHNKYFYLQDGRLWIQRATGPPPKPVRSKSKKRARVVDSDDYESEEEEAPVKPQKGGRGAGKKGKKVVKSEDEEDVKEEPVARGKNGRPARKARSEVWEKIPAELLYLPDEEEEKGKKGKAVERSWSESESELSSLEDLEDSEDDDGAKEAEEELKNEDEEESEKEDGEGEKEVAKEKEGAMDVDGAEPNKEGEAKEGEDDDVQKEGDIEEDGKTVDVEKSSEVKETGAAPEVEMKEENGPKPRVESKPEPSVDTAAKMDVDGEVKEEVQAEGKVESADATTTEEPKAVDAEEKKEAAPAAEIDNRPAWEKEYWADRAKAEAEGFVEWEAICVTLEEFEALSARLEGTKDRNEKLLRDVIVDDILPGMAERAKALEAERQANLAMMSRKRSSRLAIIESAAEEQARVAQEQAQALSRSSRASRHKVLTNTIEDSGDDSGPAAPPRETKRVAREEAIAANGGKVPAGMETPEELRQMELAKQRQELERKKAEKRKRDAEGKKRRAEQKKKEAEMAAKAAAAGEVVGGAPVATSSAVPLEGYAVDDEPWYLGCEICGLSGWNLDDETNIISCDKCSEWQHIDCHVQADARAGRPPVDYAQTEFVCASCRANPDRKPRIPPPREQKPLPPKQVKPKVPNAEAKPRKSTSATPTRQSNTPAVPSPSTSAAPRTITASQPRPAAAPAATSTPAAPAQQASLPGPGQPAMDYPALLELIKSNPVLVNQLPSNYQEHFSKLLGIPVPYPTTGVPANGTLA
ncbi:hypothetical protein MNV49_003653 [Pseudohyphozyma bogoriensis]|nr:hypothetical protein MNV49_003653 [Pseudohyphozyma bogoriensis]